MNWDCDVIFEDDYLLAVNKPAGLPTQAGHDPGRANLYQLMQDLREEKLFLHHRLDKDTSGVLLLGRKPEANKGLTEMFREHLLQKTYWALAKKAASGETPDEILVKDHLAPVRGTNKQLMRMVKVKSGGWSAETRFKLIQALSLADLWEAQPVTGRTHQIRVHLSGLTRPIFGDFLYGGKSSEVPRLMLHAKSLEFKHPVTGTQLKIEAPLPSDFTKLLAKWSSPSFPQAPPQA